MSMATKWSAWFGIIVLSAFSLILAGCEGDDDIQTTDLDGYFSEHPYITDPRSGGKSIVSISPEEAEVTFVGQTVVFRATGGRSPYNWGIANGGRGTITPTGSDQSQGVYTTTAVGQNSVIVNDQDGNAAVATISATTSISIEISGSSTLNADGDMVSLKAVGGLGPFGWSVGDSFLGSISPNAGVNVVYTRGHAGDNTVTVSDSVGNTASVVIKQP